MVCRLEFSWFTHHVSRFTFHALLFPQTVRKHVLFQVGSATRTTPGFAPGFNPVKAGHRTHRLEAGPTPRPGARRGTLAGGKIVPRILHQIEWRNGRVAQQAAAGGAGRWLVLGAAHVHARQNVVEPMAIQADDGLDGTMHAGVGATGDVRPILALRAFEAERPAHAQRLLPPG